MIKERKLEKSVGHVLSKIDALELEKINAEDNADSYTNTLKFEAEQRKDKAIKEAEQKYEQYIAYLNKLKDEMKQKAQRMFDTKKRQLELRGENVKGELEIIAECKSAPEITIKNQEQKLLQEMDIIIKGMQMGRNGEPDWYLAELSPIPTLPGEILKKSTPTLLHMPNIPYVSPEDLELQALRQAEGQRIARRERREQAERLRKKQEQEENYKLCLEKTKAIDDENNKRLEIALVLASKKQEEDDDEWSDESISRFCSGTKTIVIDDIPNTPRSEEIVQELIQSLNSPA
jgi:hypothetical protein